MGLDMDGLTVASGGPPLFERAAIGVFHTFAEYSKSNMIIPRPVSVSV